ncbi:SRPBCC domain-containing protein [Nocardiopsis coralliicola]
MGVVTGADGEAAGDVGAVHREVSAESTPQGPARAVTLRSTLEPALEKVWAACTEPAHLAAWFYPVGGDLRPGGAFQVDGIAHGEILSCEPPRLLRLSWVLGGTDGDHFGEVELRLAAAGRATSLTLHHTAAIPEEMWLRYGPGAMGVGWDLMLHSLALHLRGATPDDQSAWASSDGARSFTAAAAHSWAAAHRAAGAVPEQADYAAEATAAFYTTGPT